MSDDVIANAAMEFITANERHMGLAYKIEEVVPRIREQAVARVLRRVENSLSEAFGRDEWDVKLLRGTDNRPQSVRATKESWKDRFEDRPGPTWRGVRLVANCYTDWSSSNISLTPLKDSDKTRIREVFIASGIGTSRTTNKYHYVELQDELRDWNGSAFAIRAFSEADRVAEELANKMYRLCAGIDNLLGEHRE